MTAKYVDAQGLRPGLCLSACPLLATPLIVVQPLGHQNKLMFCIYIKLMVAA